MNARAGAREEEGATQPFPLQIRSAALRRWALIADS